MVGACLEVRHVSVRLSGEADGHEHGDAEEDEEGWADVECGDDESDHEYGGENGLGDAECGPDDGVACAHGLCVYGY